MQFSSSLTLAPSCLWALSRSTPVSPGETYAEQRHLMACCGSPVRKSYETSSAWHRKCHVICYLNEKQQDWFQFTLQANLIHSTFICIRNRGQGEISSHVLSQKLMLSPSQELLLLHKLPILSFSQKYSVSLIAGVRWGSQNWIRWFISTEFVHPFRCCLYQLSKTSALLHVDRCEHSRGYDYILWDLWIFQFFWG